ncbi:MAG: Sec-independent protein translocase protein TatB [Venatoribacter sp.]
MFDIGFSELMLIAILALIVLGPERLPQAARTVGLIVGKIKRSMAGLQEELERQVRTEELKEKLKDPYATFIDDDTRAMFDPSFKKEEKTNNDESKDSKKP